ncbi:unannotated protein [freshwater metagenome]|uniref:Unannotated protein n=1 Tax=freshwater metagenome TaxID=449393 RepID=A0A6J6XI84_9ZZZZ
MVERQVLALWHIGAHALEAGAQLGEIGDGGAGTGELVVIEGERAVVVKDRDERALEAALRNGFLCTNLAIDAEGIALFAGEAFDRGDEVG